MDLTRFAIGGVAPRQAVRPATRDEAAETLRAASREGLGVVPWGGGVALPFETAPPNYDLALDLSALDRVVEYEPADLTLTAECGATIAALRAALAAHGQELPLEAAVPSRATLGGVMAANASGPRRRRFGAPRDRVLGARYLLGDGSIARTGGKVVKNVAGYGLHRMLCGSRGGLAVILEASLKLQPAPAAQVALIYGADAPLLADRERWSPLARIELSALSVMSANLAGADLAVAGARFTVVVALEDDAAWVAEQERAVARAIGTPAARCEGPEAAALLGRLADLEETEGTRLTFASADTLPPACSRLASAQRHGLTFLFHALAGRIHAWPGDAPGAEPGFSEAGLTLLHARASGGGPAPAPPIPPQVAILGMRRALRRAIDPAARFALGASWAGEMPPGAAP